MIEIQLCSSENLKPIPPSQQLGFGQHFSDHWFYSGFSQQRGWHGSRIEPYGQVTLDPAASVLHYGQALFEGMKAFAQADGTVALFRPEFNYNRLKEGADRLCLEAPPRALFMEALKELITIESRWVPKQEQCALYIRPTLIGTEAFLGVRPAREILFYIILSPVGSYYGKSAPTRIYVEDRALRAAPGGLGAVKAGANYAASLQAAQKAKSKGYDQVLWLDFQHEGIEEVGTMNVFLIIGDEIVTPALNGSILSGGMRDSVIRLLRSKGQKVVERRITIQEILAAHERGLLREAFGTGTAAVVSPIGELSYKDNSYIINNNEPGAFSKSVFSTITGIQYGLSPDEFGWMVPASKLA
jgi:branched-chain amino acid aminotransferase